MRRFWLSLFASFSLFAQANPVAWSGRPASEEESLFLRRIADFWQEEEYGIAKQQIEEFLSAFPGSAFADPLYAALGDLWMREGQYVSALDAYSALSSADFTDRFFFHRMECLYRLGRHSTLAEECEERLKQLRSQEETIKTTYFLAIALYHQCVNASQESEARQQWARKAEPYFETLLESAFWKEAAEPFASLCRILKNYPKAANLYLSLAEKTSEESEEMLFQAALLQAEYDRELALGSLQKIIEKEGERAQEAAYYHLVLSFEGGRYEEIASRKDALLNSMSADRKALSRFLLGKSFLALGKYEAAMEELRACLEESPSSEPALACLLDAAYRVRDADAVNEAFARILDAAPESPLLSKGQFFKALLYKQSGSLEEARSELSGLLARAPEFPEREQAMLEGIDLEYQAGCWESCREQARAFTAQYPNSPLAASAWRCLVAASGRLAAENSALQEQLAQDLASLLAQKDLLPLSETQQLQFFFAKALYDLGRFRLSIDALQSLLEEDAVFPEEANARLLLGLCYRDGLQDLAAFCLHAEKAIGLSAELAASGPLRASLFNAYVELSKNIPPSIERAAEHLYAAFCSKVSLDPKNLLWLGEWYAAKSVEQEDPALAGRAAELFSFLAAVDDEAAIYNMGKLYASAGQAEQQIAWMERLSEVYVNHPLRERKWETPAQLLLAEGYAAIGKEEQALSLFDAIIERGCAMYSEPAAKASLEKARIQARRIQREGGDLKEPAAALKNLILRRKLANEPIHLEAAIEYANLMGNSPEKRMRLLEKIKKDFENTEDLISKDYQEARRTLEAQNSIYEGYMRWIDGEILLMRSILAPDDGSKQELWEQAQDLFSQIKKEKAHPLLMSRAGFHDQNARWIHAPISE